MQGMMPLFLSVLAGACLLASLNHFLIGAKSRYIENKNAGKEHLVFSFLCGINLFGTIALITLISTNDKDIFKQADDWHKLFFAASFGVILWFVRVFSGINERKIFSIFTVANLLFIFLCLIKLIGITFYQADGIKLSGVPAPISPWLLSAIIALIYLQFFYMAYCCLAGFKKSRDSGALYLLAAITFYYVCITIDSYLLFKDGEDFHLAALSFLLFISLMSTHITGKQHTQVIENNEQRYKRLIEGVRNDHIVYSCNSEGKFLYVSPSIEKILGFPPDEVIGQHWDLIIKRGASSLSESTHMVVQKTSLLESFNFERELLDSHENKRLFDIVHQHIKNNAGDIVSIEGFARDITKQRHYENKLLEFNAELEFRVNERTEELQGALSELRKEVSEKHFLEQQLMQAQKMESIGQLAGGVAHDFNNIMTAIAGFSELAINDSHKGKNVSMDLEQILEAASRGSKLTEQLLSFARKQIAVPQVINPNEVLEDAMKFLPRMLSGKAELLFNPNPDVWPIKIDPVQFDQIIINLVVNARDAMSEGLSDNEIILEVHNFQFEQAQALTPIIIPEQEYVCLSVTDTGKGIPPELHQKIFEPFFTTKAIGKGSGLGLSVCYGVVKQYGGYIFVDSDVGEGTTFYILFPRVMVSGINFPKRQTLNDLLSDSSGGNETLLLVEDDPAVAMLTQKILMSSGYRVLTAVNGLDALDVAEKNSGAIDLVVTDVMMPKMDGKELVDTLRLLSPSIEIICVSGFADSDVIAELRKKNVTFLAKPYTPLQLVKIVRTVLNQRSIKSGLSHPA